MREMGIPKLLVIALCLTGYFKAVSQTDYVVLTLGDTIAGKVTFLNYGTDQKVQLSNDSKKKTVYTMRQVKAFQLNDEIYHLIKYIDRYVYLKLLSSGYLSLYAFQIDNQQNWDGRYLYKRDGKGMEVPNIGFKKKMQEFVAECDELSTEISNGQLGRNDLSEIIIKYNKCIDQRTTVNTQAHQQKIDLAEKANSWDELETRSKASDNLSDKETVLEMITEARSKTEKGEKIPKFLLDGLKKSLEGDAELYNLLTEVLKEIDQ